ncbi:hypothetical protein GCM10011320_18960 [Neoroseomonas lacus]|uniref:Uncharacterized protein n=1 Tax=Neoroseomonas lacus TaxID=287609 RepID=A0A917KHV8_9PROT|nr:hypothetical protein GCM10011320_18960 [Neoroseomonas lacus]
MSTRLKPAVWLLATLSDTWPRARACALRPVMAVVMAPNKDIAFSAAGEIGLPGSPQPACQGGRRCGAARPAVWRQKLPLGRQPMPGTVA